MFASGVEESAIPQGYIEIASKTEDLGDGITLEKTLAVESSRARVGFSGQRSTMVIHRYSQNGGERLVINAVAAFSYSTSEAKTRLDSKRLNITPMFPEWGVRLPADEDITNEPGGATKYTVTYNVLCPPLVHKGKHTLWIECSASGDMSTSGNMDWRSAIAKDDVVVYDNIAYRFG